MRLRPQLFFSYRRTQLERVQPVVKALESLGVGCFLDVQSIDPLADFPQVIRLGIDRSHAFLAWWSKDYGESDICLQEFRRAWQHARRHSSDLERRIWVVNPEATAHHIFAGELNSKNFLRPPVVGAESDWLQSVLKRLQALLPEGPLADERQSAAVPVLYNVPMKSAEFTGRGRELMSIHSKLHPADLGANGAAVAVQTHGAAGIGKTELAAAYARDFAGAYPGGVYWLNLAGWNPRYPAREEEAHYAWLRALEEALGLDTERTRALTRDAENDSLSPGAVRERLAIQLSQQSDYLWILDNVPELSPLDARGRILDFIRAPTAAGRTLLTTRDGRVADGFAQEQLEVLSEEDALRLLARFRAQTAHVELDAMRALVTEVGAHTQALILLGEHARNYPGGYPRVLEHLMEAGRLERLEQIAAQLRDLLGAKARGIVATFALSIEPLGYSERRVLAFASLCAPNLPIPDALLADVFGGREGEDLFNSALSQLLRAWLLSRRKDKDQSVFIHPLVAAATIHLFKLDKTALHRQLADVLLERTASVLDIRMHEGFLEEIQQVRELGQMLEDESGVRMLLRAGRFEHVRGRYTETRSLVARALALARRVLGEEHPDTVASMNNLAVTLKDLGDLSGARALQEQVWPISRRLWGNEHPATLTSMDNLAATLMAQGDVSGARALHEQVWSISRRVLGEEHPDTLRSMSNLAETLSAQGDLRGARALEEQVLSVRRRVLGEDYPDTLDTMSNLAETLRAQGDLSGARTLHEQVWSIRRRVLGEEHPDTLSSMSNLAAMLSDQGDLSDARALQERVWSIRRRSLGEEHPDTLTSMNNLAATLKDQGDLSSARALHEQVLLISRRVLGQEHPNTLNSMNNLAGTLRDQGDLSGARALQEQVLLISRRVLGQEHPNTLNSMNSLATTLKLQGDLSGARATLEQILLISRRVLGEEHPDTLISMNNLAATLRAQRDLSGARALHEQVWSISRRVLGQEHPHTLNSMNSLAATMRAQGELSAARTLHEQVLSINRRVLGEEHVATTISAWDLLHCLIALEEGDAARELVDDHLGWLIERDPATLSADQNKIRGYLLESMVGGNEQSE